MTIDELIAKRSFELYELKKRMELIRNIADNGNREGDLIEIVSICDSSTSFEGLE